MKTKFLSILLLFGSTNLCFGQKDTITLQNERAGHYLFCKNDWERIHSGLKYSRNDSLNNCFWVTTFTTNKKQIDYQKEYNLDDKLVAEGPIIYIENKKKLFIRTT